VLDGGLLIVDPRASFIGSIVGGYGALELAVGNGGLGLLTGFGTGIVNFHTIAFDEGARWTIAGNTGGLSGTITGFAPGDTIDLVGLQETVYNYAAGTLTLTGEQTVKLKLPGDFTTSSFHTAPDAGTGTNLTTDAPCFLSGAMIATPDGEVPVERLVAGDRVLTLNGKPRRVVWVGTGKVLATGGRCSAATPVIVRNGALADNVPHRDLRVTKGHSLFIDGVLIPVEHLINYHSILWDTQAR